MSLLSQIRQDARAVAAAAEANLRDRLAANSAGCPSNVADGAAGCRVIPASAAGSPGSNLLSLERVEIVDEWILPDVAWLPRFFRGLPVVQVLGPVPFHGERSPPLGSVAASPASTSSTGLPSSGSASPPLPTIGAVVCATCSNNVTWELGGLLFWEQAGPARTIRCVECFPPPMRRLVADLWLVEWDPAGRDGAGTERWACASDSEQWKRVAFAHLAAAEAKQREANAANVKRDNEGF